MCAIPLGVVVLCVWSAADPGGTQRLANAALRSASQLVSQPALPEAVAAADPGGTQRLANAALRSASQPVSQPALPEAVAAADPGGTQRLANAALRSASQLVSQPALPEAVAAADPGGTQRLANAALRSASQPVSQRDLPEAVAPPRPFGDRLFSERLFSFAERFVGEPVAPERAPVRSAVDGEGTGDPVALTVALSGSAQELAPFTPMPGRNQRSGLSLPEFDSHTAIYDISAHTVYLPNGRSLEAHSGLGRSVDNPRNVSLKNRGSTPPNAYDLELRERLFHGVRALRLIPAGEGKMFGRDGILAHSYMLGRSGQSNGCVAFNNYPAFLRAFLDGQIDRLVVVDHLASTPRFAAARS